jgi:hypothetical protein
MAMKASGSATALQRAGSRNHISTTATPAFIKQPSLKRLDLHCEAGFHSLAHHESSRRQQSGKGGFDYLRSRPPRPPPPSIRSQPPPRMTAAHKSAHRTAPLAGLRDEVKSPTHSTSEPRRRREIIAARGEALADDLDRAAGVSIVVARSISSRGA